MIIRESQMQTFSQHSATKFEDEMLAHIKKFFPEDYEELGDNNTLDMIREGIENSARYEIRSEKDVCRYIDLMVIFGTDFDIDSELVWMAEILNDVSLDESEKMDQIYENISQQSLPEDKV